MIHYTPPQAGDVSRAGRLPLSCFLRAVAAAKAGDHPCHEIDVVISN